MNPPPDSSARSLALAAADALLHSRESFDAIVRACPLAVMLLDERGHVHVWNPAAERIFGWRAEEVFGKFLPAVPAERREEFLANLQRIFEGADVLQVETQRQTRERGLIDVQLWANRIELPDGRRFCLGLVADVSHWRRLARQHALQLEVTRLLAEATTLDEVLPQCLRAICEGMGCQVGQWWALAPDQPALRRQAFYSASPGGEDAFTRRSAELSFQIGEGLPGQVWKNRRPIFLSDLSNDAWFTRLREARGLGLQAGGALPIEIGGQFVGVMEFFRRSAFSSEEAPHEIFEALGRQVGQFAERLRHSAEREQALRDAQASAEEARRQARRLNLLAESSSILSSSLDLAKTLDQLAQLLVPTFADVCSVSIVSPEGRLERVAEAALDDETMRKMVAFREAPPPEDALYPLGEVLRTKQARLYVDYQGAIAQQLPPEHSYSVFIRELAPISAILAPMMLGERVIGVMGLGTMPDTGRLFGEEDLTLAVALAQRAAVAIENARLHEAALAADRRKDEFLAMLGHELRNPLAPIRTALELMRLRVGDDVLGHERQVIERQMDHLQRLVNDLLDVARITRGKLHLDREPLELWAVLARAIEMISPLLDQKQHALRVEVPREGLRLNGDRHRLAQVFSNLLSNAARYTENGGRIELSAVREHDRVVVRVRDNGRGIDSALLPRVFELFEQGAGPDRQQGGLGIGLALVKNLVELHGGEVRATSAGKGQGSEFLVRLPLMETAAREAPREEPLPPRARERQVRLLLVDDNREAAEALAEALGMMGYEVRVAFDPVQALREAEAFSPEVTICDLGLPVMDGYELGRQLRAQQVALPPRLIALTGYGQEKDRERSRDAGFEAHLVKPVQLNALLSTLERVLDAPAQVR